MARWVAGRAARMAVLAVLCASAVHAADRQDSGDRLQPEHQAQTVSTAQTGVRNDGGKAAAAQGPERVGPAAEDALLEQTRQRLEQHLEEQRELGADPQLDPELERRSMRFGVGYERRMRGRQQFGFDSPGGIGAGAGPGGGFGGAPGSGFGGAPGGGRR